MKKEELTNKRLATEDTLYQVYATIIYNENGSLCLPALRIFTGCPSSNKEAIEEYAETCNKASKVLSYGVAVVTKDMRHSGMKS